MIGRVVRNVFGVVLLLGGLYGCAFGSLFGGAAFLDLSEGGRDAWVALAAATVILGLALVAIVIGEEIAGRRAATPAS